MSYFGFGCILIIHVMLCILLAKTFNGESYGETIFAAIFMMFIPILGVILLIIVKMKKTIPYREQIRNIASLKEKNEESIHLIPIDKNEELNKISMEEALNVGSFEVRRKMIMNTVKGDDIIEYLGCLKQALKNDDVETVHYASALIMETQRKINELVMSMKVRYKRDPSSEKNIENLENALEKIIFSGVYDDRNLNRYYEEYRKLSDEILKEDKILEKYYLNRIRVDFKIGDLKNAGNLCKRYREDFKESEEMIKCNIKYFIETHDRKKLDEFLESINDIKDNLTYDSLKYINFFS